MVMAELVRITGARITPVAFEDPPLLNAVGVHEPYALRAIIQLRQRTGHPVLLVDAGCFCGICVEAEIVRALAGNMVDLHGAA